MLALRKWLDTEQGATNKEYAACSMPLVEVYDFCMLVQAPEKLFCMVSVFFMAHGSIVQAQNRPCVLPILWLTGPAPYERGGGEGGGAVRAVRVPTTDLLLICFSILILFPLAHRRVQCACPQLTSYLVSPQ